MGQRSLLCNSQALSAAGGDQGSLDLEAAQRACVRRTLSALRAAVSCRCKAVERPREVRGRDASAEKLSNSDPELTLQGPSPAPLLPAAPVAVLFSGGVDSTLLAALAHECLEPALPIDLVSICFDGGASPDRASALDALAELADWAPARRWRLLLLDATLADVDLHAPRLLRLLRPADTVMDLNIGAALWLAARARAPRLRAWDPESLGMLETAAEPGRCFESAAKVVLVGHGADEVFGGYGRHRTRFREAGWQGLDEELELDLGRLWLRNLGRDDRLIADHGREARHPFLDEDLLRVARSSRLDELVDLRQGPGVGDKRVLRQCLVELGLPRAAARVKRAIQFGTRIGKHSNVRQFGGTRKANLASAGGVRLCDVPSAATRGQGNADGEDVLAKLAS
ncbi:hypothetical protein QBZ16_002355 [Prototheca wickerhamii]|uniref:Asparagine synthetase domain-containing protein n=1 Tax=Prototheca wickerhamii TaxID=3111 RepID=A0AAD9IMB4_PROWI|nr:hypothetical protein QBZ16_002355 [Prototheca wickerhamii]